MGTVREVLNKDRLSRPWNPHMFVVPRLMTHLWRKILVKDMDVLFTVQVGKHFWESPQHEPLIVALILPLSHVDKYMGPWLSAGTSQARNLVCELDLNFKFYKKGWWGNWYGAPLTEIGKDEWFKLQKVSGP